MTLQTLDEPTAWLAADLENDKSWIYRIDPKDALALADAVRRVADPARALLDYRRDEFDLGPAARAIGDALREVKHGRGIALVKGLPREGMTEKQFEILTWAIGLHAGVPRPQGKATQYISAVANAGMEYRTGTGRGYSSNAELDFHTDSSDVIFLSCYNRSVSGGMSIISSSAAGHAVMAQERPDDLKWLYEPIGFSRQGEQAPDEGPFVMMPVFSERDGKWFGRWNWNRVRSAQQIEGVPKLAAEQYKALEAFDEIMRRKELAYEMWLEPGDMQIFNSHVTLHSRTEFVDHDDPAKRRLLYRLWIAPPLSAALPECWRDLYRSCEPGVVRGGIRGFEFGETQKAFERRQAQDAGMPAPVF